MLDFVDIVEVGKEKPISSKKAASVLQAFITANSGNENDTFDESRILDDIKLEQLNQILSSIQSNRS
ncbi:uncharacterized protein [Blastocystis hominis]|uniref:Uncharacterized protein n=1 Tax=Blastocystis hominis TaxID=12968 RepID=D8LWL2_BLAHO|nr:uncharacterized protein [Blastocystis hominis]CBK20201.2 unnamed protein product [Blastocystis hominis]|eukprot:XP_012894249.1 uncharacterized protein [Blastocystis hominis]